MLNQDLVLLKSRYDLLCKATQAEADNHLTQPEWAVTLEQVIQHDVPQLVEMLPCSEFKTLHQSLRAELEALREYAEFPCLAGKILVGAGGAFSAGKSSFINAIQGTKTLTAEIDPTTSLPSYLLKGDRDEISAINQFGNRVRLSEGEFSSLTHDEHNQHGSQIAAKFKSACLVFKKFPFSRIALVDTPGYSKPDDTDTRKLSDEAVARAMLNTMDYVLWFVSAESGGLSENDLNFLQSLNASIPKLVLISRADKRRPEDVAAIVSLIRKTLTKCELDVIDVIPYSARKKQQYPLNNILNHLKKWDRRKKRPSTFSEKLANTLNSYQTLLTEKIEANQNKLAILSDFESEQASTCNNALRMTISELKSRDKSQDHSVFALVSCFYKELLSEGSQVAAEEYSIRKLVQIVAEELKTGTLLEAAELCNQLKSKLAEIDRDLV